MAIDQVRNSEASTPNEQPWHAVDYDAAIHALESCHDGLSAREAAIRVERDGPNELPAPVRANVLIRLLGQLNNWLIYFLLAAAAAAALLGQTVDAAVIVIVVVANAVVGFVQEGRAEQSLDAIRNMIAPRATVLRDGKRHAVDARDIARGDLVVLEAGDKVPADLRVTRARGLLVDEAILTGESEPAQKQEAPVATDAPLGDRLSMLYSGTLVATGQATGVAVATGARTEIGKISVLIGEVESLTTPLLRQINQFGRLFTAGAALMALAVFVFALLVRNYPWVDALMVTVALAVGVVPEGLPAVITITLAIGVRRMAARNAVVRKLPAVETLGATSVICSDKTGTLTRNEMTVRRLVTPTGEVAVTGTGYAPTGALEHRATHDDLGSRLVLAGLLCNDAHIEETAGQWQALGDPMEAALVTLAAKAGTHPEATRELWPRLDELPFDARHRFMATLHRAPDGCLTVFVKGAPERVLAMCGSQSAASGCAAVDVAYWERKVTSAASHGERVLGFAAMTVSDHTGRLSFEAVQDGHLTFLGVAGLIDPPREEAVAAVAACRSAGIAVKMITGDHCGTALAIARQLSLSEEPIAMEGKELDALSDADLRQAVGQISVFARTTPEHKLRIVRALQANGHIVAMTGDGVNDAPALKQADVGVAMGRKGTEAAKEAAEMVLVDDNFASIVAAVQEGRTVYDNIRKVIGWTLPTNIGETVCVILALALGMALPMTPVQILWINMVLTITLGLVLAFEPSEPGVMGRPPRRRDAPILSRFLVWRIGFVSLLFTAGVFFVFDYALRRGLGEDGARTMVVNVLVVMEIFYLFNVRYLHTTSFSLTGAMGTPAVLGAVTAVVVAQLAFTYLPLMQSLFGSTSLSIEDGSVVLLVGVALMAVLEVEKAFMRRLRSGRQPAVRAA